MQVVLYFRPSEGSKPGKLAGVLDIAQKANIHIQVIDNAVTEKRIQSLLSFWDCRGAIIECGSREEDIAPAMFGNTPVIFFNRSFDTLPKGSFAVQHDSKSTGTLAARELLLFNYSSFAYIPAMTNPFWSQERRQGFVEALALNGKTCIDFTWPDRTDTDTKRMKDLKDFLQELPKPCAVFAANDVLAADVIMAARLLGLSIPNDIAVLGVDNATDICEHTSPTLSSIEPDFRRGGNLAMLLLLAVMRYGKAFHGSRQRTFADLHVVRRLSTKRLTRPDPLVAQALELIRKKACNGLKAAEVLRLFSCSRRMAYLRFSRAVGHSILDEIQAVRLDRAKQLLLNPNQELKALATFCGFKNQNSLRKFFLKETGMTLSEWQKKYRNKLQSDNLPSA